MPFLKDLTYQTQSLSGYDFVAAGIYATPASYSSGFNLQTQQNGPSAIAVQNTIARPGVPYALKVETRNMADVQWIKSPGISGGTFSLTWNGSTASSIPYNVTRSSLETTLNGLSSVISDGGLTVHSMNYSDGNTNGELLGGTTLNDGGFAFDNRYHILFNTPGSHSAWTASSPITVGSNSKYASNTDGSVFWTYDHTSGGTLVAGPVGGTGGIPTDDTVYHTSPGYDTYYGMSFYWPSSNAGTWVCCNNQFWEFIMSGGWASTGSGGGVLFEFTLATDGRGGSSIANPLPTLPFYVDSSGNNNPVTYWTSSDPLVYDTWYDLILRIKWTLDATGLFELWERVGVNGTRTKVFSTVDGTGGAPAGGLRTYPNQMGGVGASNGGIYVTGSYPTTVYDTGVRIADTLAGADPATYQPATSQHRRRVTMLVTN